MAQRIVVEFQSETLLLPAAIQKKALGFGIC